MAREKVALVEVGPRDGFQGIGSFIATERKKAFIRELSSAGISQIEIGSFVSVRALPQMADVLELLAASKELDSVVSRVLVPNEKYALRALEAGVRFPVFVLSVSNSHNRSNVRRSTDESVEEYLRIVDSLPADADLRLDLSTVFDCPFEGRIPEDAVFQLLERLVPARPEAEICLCDTTGKAVPDQVASVFSQAQRMFPGTHRWVIHAHDTYGLGLANVYAAYQTGIRTFDASFSGLGGCPFAPGATGNVATEDVVWMFERMGVETGVSLERLIPISQRGTTIEGGSTGGRVRHAILAACARATG